MKTLLLLIPAILIPSCATDPATGRSTVRPEVAAAAGRLAVAVINAAEAGAAARINETLRVHPDK